MTTKQRSERSAEFAKGGNGHMVGKTTVGTQKPGHTTAAAKSAGSNNIAVKGGNGHMVGKTPVKPSKKQ